jgi:type IV secretion system protein VirB2
LRHTLRIGGSIANHISSKFLNKLQIIMKNFSAFLAKVSLLSFFFLAIAPAIVPVLSADAFAADSYTTTTAGANNNVLVDVMCNVMQIITGNAGKAFAAFAIISIGIGFFTGKVSWGLMIGVAAGIAAMFGAPAIVAAITGGGAFECGRGD